MQECIDRHHRIGLSSKRVHAQEIHILQISHKGEAHLHAIVEWVKIDLVWTKEINIEGTTRASKCGCGLGQNQRTRLPQRVRGLVHISNCTRRVDSSWKGIGK